MKSTVLVRAIDKGQTTVTGLNELVCRSSGVNPYLCLL